MLISNIYPALYYLFGSDGDCVALMASHVDDLLYAYLPKGGNSEEILVVIRPWINRNRQLQILWKAICS